MQLVIRPFQPSDEETVRTLFSIGIREHIGPCFRNAMTRPLHLATTVALCVVGYLLSSVLGAVVLTGVWVGFVYSCCHFLYASFVEGKLRTDMQDIPGHYQSRPDDCFWVAEAQVDGRSQILGIVAILAKQSGKERHGELFRMIISPSCRRSGLGTRLTQTAIDFCKERGFSKIVLETSSTQSAAVALYEKMGFALVHTHTKTHAPSWVVPLTGVTIFVMEKRL
ncbi:probable N-acetyltransferase camello [Xyrichtys novacula]|uniref:Probable N-acetyltransferase camello n=1 Tax=Xyrichtys novacula TaxID=13765 RepID=A0AAV1ENE5_XYRNO|nr:probable N-acetyltransferase camello [Xyrichtys novacula]